MPLIIEDGTGRADAESLVSVAEADAYHAARANTAWAALDNTAKEARLRYSAAYLSAMWQFIGSPVNGLQALAWPRVFIGSTIVPAGVKNAQMELALIANLNAAEAERAVKSKQVDVLRTEYEDGATTPAKRFPLVHGLLKQYLASGSGSARLVKG